jgi:cytochrome P450
LARLKKMQCAPLRCLTQFTRESPGLYPLDRQHSILLVSEPDAVKEILDNDSECFSKGALPIGARLVIGDGTATSWFPQDDPAHGDFDHYGRFGDLEDWRSAKHTAISKALGDSPLEEWLAAARQLAHEACAEWRAGQVVDIYAIAHTLFFRLSMTRLFQCPVSPEGLEANTVVRRSANAVNRHLRSNIGSRIEYFDRLYIPRGEAWRFLPGRHFDSLRRRRAAIDLLGSELLEMAMSDHPSALLSQVMSAQPASEKQSLNTLRSALIGLLLASYENSAAAAAWLIWCLAAHRQWQSASTAEILTNPLPCPTIGTLKHHAPSLWNSLQETLRLYPPVWSLGRRLKCDARIGGFHLKTGSTVLISPWLQHRHPRLWSHPDRFDPTRFIGSPTPERGIFLPFGAGAHSCPAEAFARLSICAVIGRWLESWRFQLAPDYPLPQPMLGLTQRPQGAVWVRLAAPD